MLNVSFDLEFKLATDGMSRHQSCHLMTGWQRWCFSSRCDLIILKQWTSEPHPAQPSYFQNSTVRFHTASSSCWYARVSLRCAFASLMVGGACCCSINLCTLTSQECDRNKPNISAALPHCATGVLKIDSSFEESWKTFVCLFILSHLVPVWEMLPQSNQLSKS